MEGLSIVYVDWAMRIFEVGMGANGTECSVYQLLLSPDSGKPATRSKEE